MGVRSCLIRLVIVCGSVLAQASAEGADIATVQADLDGDGTEDSFAIVCSRAPTPDQRGAFTVEGQMAGQTYAIGPYSALQADRSAQRLPDEVATLQVLPEGPLAALDVNLDGRLELVARFRLPYSRLNVLTLIIAWDPEKQDLVPVWEDVADGVLCMDASGGGDLVLLPYGFATGRVPVFMRAHVWRDGQYRESLSPLPARLAAALMPVYARQIGRFDTRGDVYMLQEYVRAAIAAGNSMAASSAVGRVLGELEQAEASIKSTRRQALILRGDVFAAMGVTGDALRAYREAFALEGEEGFGSPDGFAAFHLAIAKAAAGDLTGAAEWLDRAEEAEGEPGKFERTREALVAP